jgi:CRISPR system Cascade subunit CasE
MRMYLSQVVLDRMARHAMRTLSDVYRLHQFVMSGFSGYEQPSRVLFRVEPEVRGAVVRVLVQSQVEPDWEQAGADEKGVVKIQTKEFIPQFQQGSLYQFRLRSNPVVTREGKRYGLIREDALVHWLKKKEEQIGASFLSVLAVDEGYATGARKKGEAFGYVNIKTARFDGMLEVVGPTRFNEAFIRGIGPAKAFGCGLLSLARA